MTNNAIDLTTASKPDSAMQPITKLQNDQPTSKFYPKGFNYDDAIPSVCEFYAGKYISASEISIGMGFDKK